MIYNFHNTFPSFNSQAFCFQNSYVCSGLPTVSFLQKRAMREGPPFVCHSQEVHERHEPYQHAL